MFSGDVCSRDGMSLTWGVNMWVGVKKRAVFVNFPFISRLFHAPFLLSPRNLSKSIQNHKRALGPATLWRQVIYSAATPTNRCPNHPPPFPHVFPPFRGTGRPPSWALHAARWAAQGARLRSSTCWRDSPPLWPPGLPSLPVDGKLKEQTEKLMDRCFLWGLDKNIHLLDI